MADTPPVKALQPVETGFGSDIEKATQEMFDAMKAQAHAPLDEALKPAAPAPPAVAQTPPPAPAPTAPDKLPPLSQPKTPAAVDIPKAEAEEPEIPPPDTIKSTKAADDWRKADALRRQTIKEKRVAEAALKAATAELEKLRKSPFSSTEVEALKKERDELDARLRVLDIERHPKFIAHFTEKLKQQAAMAKTIVGKDRADAVETVLKMADSPQRTEQLDKLMEELSPSQQSRLGNVLGMLDMLAAEREAELEKSAQSRELLIESERAESARQQAAFEAAFTDELAAASATESGIAAFQQRGDDASWNADLGNRVTLAKAIYAGRLPVQDRARAALWAATAPLLLQQNLALAQETARLQSELARARNGGAAPAPGAGAPTPSPNDLPDDLPLAERIVRLAQNAGAFNT